MKPLSPVCWCHTLLIVPLLTDIKAAAVAAAATAAERIRTSDEKEQRRERKLYSAQLDAIPLN